jgi:hypothetical protein
MMVEPETSILNERKPQIAKTTNQDTQFAHGQRINRITLLANVLCCAALASQSLCRDDCYHNCNSHATDSQSCARIVRVPPDSLESADDFPPAAAFRTLAFTSALC